MLRTALESRTAQELAKSRRRTDMATKLEELDTWLSKVDDLLKEWEETKAGTEE